MLAKNQTYSQSICINYCLSLKYKKTSNCNCSYQTLEGFWTNCANSFDHIIECTQNFIGKLASNPFVEYSNYCSLECNSLTYSISQKMMPVLLSGNSSLGFPYDHYFGTLDNFSRNYYSINVYFVDL